MNFLSGILMISTKIRQKETNTYMQSTWRVVCTLIGGVAPTPAGLLIGRPFWLSLCLLFSNGLLAVPPWSLRTDSALSGVALPSSWKIYHMVLSHSHQKSPKCSTAKDSDNLNHISLLRRVTHRSVFTETHHWAVCIRQELSKLWEQVFLVLEEPSHLSVDLLLSQCWSVVPSCFFSISLLLLEILYSRKRWWD